MHSSGPRPKSHVGSPNATSSPTFTGAAQFRFAVPAAELPVGLQCTASCWPLTVGVLPLLKTTSRSPFGSTTGSDPWSKLHAPAGCVVSIELPNWQSVLFTPLISCGVDQWIPWSVDIEPKIGERW